ncbi:MAG: VanZ family protein [Oscillospiraceae bacterium]|nr:VanZ family protein [Oscillospiraceae bacterium]
MVRSRARLWGYGLLTLAIMCMIFFMSAKDGTESSSMSEWLLNTAFGQFLIRLLPRLTDYGEELDIRKYAHMAEYAMLAFSSGFFFREVFLDRIPRRSLCCGGLFCLLYACSDEYHQTFVAGRVGSAVDVMVDMVGVTAGLIIVFLICILRKELK